MFSFIKKASQSVSLSEKRFLALAILILLLLSSLSSIYGQIKAGRDYYFTGYNVLAGADKSVYFSQIEQARQGQILFKNLYTSEAQKAKFFAPIWLILGKIGKLTNLSNLLIFQLVRIICAALFLYFLYLFISRIFDNVFYRKLAFLVCGFASGFGIFTLKRIISEEIIYNSYGTDLWVSEGNTFLTLAHSPLFILSQLFILLFFWWLIERLAASRYPEVLAVSLIILFLGIFHPYDLVTIYLVSVVWLIAEFLRQKKINWSAMVKLLVIIAISSLAIIYFFWLFQSEPALGRWAKQNLTLSPRFLNYAIGYSLLFIGVLIALYQSIKSQSRYLRFLAVWIIVGWLLLFVPFSFQRRLANGLHLPMAIVGFIGLIILANWLKKVWPKLAQSQLLKSIVLVLVILSLSLTNLYNIFQEVVLFSHYSAPYYISYESYEAMLWIKNNLSREQVILAEPIDGNIIPAITANAVYLGHGHQTSDWLTKMYKVKKWFFASNKQDQEKKDWLKREGIDYIFFSPREDGLGSYNPAGKEYLEKVYDNGEVKIYRVAIF